MRGFVDRMKALEEDGTRLSVSAIHGFMAGDSPDLGAKIVVVTDNDPVKGD
jgi:microcystin degradation protein MlrC